MICCNCNNEIDDNSVFCKYCGARQHTQERTSFAYVLREWFYSRLTDSREDRAIEGSTYYLSEEFAFKLYEDGYKKNVRVFSRHSEYRVSPITRVGDRLNNPVTLNSLSGVIAFYDIVKDNYKWRYEIIKTRIHPELIYNPNIKQDILNYVFEEYVIIDDSHDHHRGYVQTDEIYTDAHTAMEHMEKELNSYRMTRDVSFDIHDERGRCHYEYGEGNWYYWVVLSKNGHNIRMFSIRMQAFLHEDHFY